MKKRIAAVAFFAAIAPASAQQSTTLDPRLASPAINALQAMIALRDAEVKMLHEDAAKRESDWAAYSKPLWQDPVQTSQAPVDEQK